MQAKSREDWSYGYAPHPILKLRGHIGAGVERRPRIRLSRIDDYLTDNVSCIRLSDLKHSVKVKLMAARRVRNEVLVRATSIQANATDTHVIAYRIH